MKRTMGGPPFVANCKGFFTISGKANSKDVTPRLVLNNFNELVFVLSDSNECRKMFVFPRREQLLSNVDVQRRDAEKS